MDYTAGISAQHNRQKKLAVINDLSGFGKCSLAVSLPIISHMRIQACPLPTAIFSNHTGFPEFFCRDFTDYMEPYACQWKKLGLRFDGITTGFLGSEKQISIVEKFIHDFADRNTKVVIDPVMGENGRAYPTYTEKMCNEMSYLAAHADILTPNVTEACMLTSTEFKAEGWTEGELFSLTEKLGKIGAKNVVISGIHSGEYIANAVLDSDGNFEIIKQKRAGAFRSGTGDIFAAVIAADAVNGTSFKESVKKASEFVSKCVKETEKYKIPLTDGVCFENVLHTLK